MIRRIMFLSLMVGAAGIPYLLSSSSELLSSVKAKFGGAGSSPEVATGAPQEAGQSPGNSANSPVPGFPQAHAQPKDIEGAPTRNLAEVFHFNGTPAWVIERWPRVTTGLAHPDMQGYRVPLVTGTGQDDLAGSLTYYFDGNRRVEFLTFHGVTGDPRKLIALVMQRYGFLPEQTDDPGLSLYLVKSEGKPISELRIRTARVLRADQPNQRFRVDLAMKRP
jgi:hypothetical protein